MSKVWGNIGAWAAEAELAEEEEKEEAAAAAAAAAASGGGDSFPSLKEAVNTKQKKKTKMTLQEFTMQATGHGGGSRRDSAYESRGLTPEEMLRLPTGPKERSADEMQYGRLGGGFSSYGRSGGGPPGRNRDGDGDGSWGGNRRSYGGGFDDERRTPGPRASDFDQPSRADEADNWALGKKPMPTFDSSSGRSNRYSSLGGGGGSGGPGGGFSRADETDNWAMNKKPMIPARSSTFGSGFRDSSGPEPDRWSRGGGGGFREENQERRRLVLDPPRGDLGPPLEPVVKTTNKPNPFGAARPREEILAEKGLDWKKVDLELEAKRPTSSHSNSRPGSAQSSRSEGPAAAALQVQQGLEKPRPKVNPFGDAKPREVLLQEKGLDWKKIDLELEHRRVSRPETEAEKGLREELDHLKKELEKESASKESVQASGESPTNLHEVIRQKETELEQLIRDLDDKVRFGQKAIDRPGSGAGRVASFQERPPSQSGSFDDSRSVDTDRPRSRGTGDAWMRQGDDRRGFAGSRERGFLGNRDFGRSSSRERW